MAITDHSKELPIAGRMDEPTQLRQVETIDLNRELLEPGDGMRVPRSVEMNLSVEGRGDIDPEVLQGSTSSLGRSTPGSG